MSQTNSTDLNEVTDTQLEGHRAAARASLAGAKKNAAKAAAHLYMLLTMIVSSDIGRAWLVAEVAKRNASIASHNKQNKGKGRHVPIPDEPLATRVIRIVYGLDKPSEQSIASRHLKVQEQLAERFGDDQPSDVGAIESYFEEEGGFEAVLLISRGKEGVKADPKAGTVINQAIEEAVKEAIANIGTKFTMTVPQQELQDGSFIMFGTKEGGDVRCHAALPVDAKTQIPMLRAFWADILPVADGTSLLLRSVDDLCDLVPQGGSTDLHEGDNTSGAQLRVERVLVMLKSQTNTTLWITARHSDASVMVKIRPISGLTHFVPEQPIMMLPEELKKLRSLHATAGAFRFNNLHEDTTLRPVAWTVTNSALKAAKIDGAEVTAAWQLVSDEARKPLLVQHFKPFVVNLTAIQLSKDIDALCADVAEKKYGEAKGDANIHLAWDLAKLTLRRNKFLVREFVIPKPPSQAAQRLFRGSYLKAAVKAALQAGADNYRLSIDPAGMLSLAWTNAVAEYEVFIPASSSTGGLMTNKQASLSG